MGFDGNAKSKFVTAFALRATRPTRQALRATPTEHCSRRALHAKRVFPTLGALDAPHMLLTQPLLCVAMTCSHRRHASEATTPKCDPQYKYATRSRDFGQLAHDGPIHVSVSTRTWNMQLAECAQLCLNLGGVDILVNRVRTCIDHVCDRLCLCVGEWVCGTRRARATRQCPGR